MSLIERAEQIALEREDDAARDNMGDGENAESNVIRELVKALKEERERCAELAAEFVHRRLYEADTPACSYHSRQIKEAILADPT
ncbi:hypothetical protein RPALISO_194 [Ruegeria phage RpAliso]|nr:hypothetical protein RPALISO_194 [Ruegeria phage RpAliso]